MIKQFLFSLAMTALFLANAQATTYYLKNNNPNQNWNDACNWYTDPNHIGDSDCNGYPGLFDHVVINGHSFIQLQNSTTIASLHMDNGYGWIGGNFDLLITGDANIEGMAIQNNGKIRIYGNLYLNAGTLAGSDTAFVYGSTYFNGAGINTRTLVLKGHGYWAQNNIGVNFGGKLVIPAMSTLYIENQVESVSMGHSSGGYFYNYGTVIKNSAKNLTLGAYNFATGGVFSFTGGTTVYSNNLTYTNCNLTLSDHSRMEFLNGNHLFENTVVNSAGYILAAGNLFTKQFDANCSFSNDTLQLASGTWKFYIPLSVPNLIITGGSSYLYSNSTVTHSFWWKGGHLYGGTNISVYPLAHLAENGGSASYTSCKFDFLSGAEWTSGNYKLNGGSAFNFPFGADLSINLSAGAQISQNGGSPLAEMNFTPESILTKNGAGKAVLGLVCNSEQTDVLVNSGGLDLWRGTHRNSYFNINAGIALQCTQSGIFFYHSDITGNGILRETNFYSIIDSSSTLDCHLEMTGGDLHVRCPITPLSLKMTGGELRGTGQILVAGNCDWTGPALLTGTGLIDVQGFTTISGTGGRTFYKELKMSGGGLWSGTFYLHFGSLGIIRVPAGATLTLSPTTTVNNIGTQSANCGIFVEGSLVKTSNYEFDFQGADFVNNGSIEGIGTFRTSNNTFVQPNTGALSAGIPGTPGMLNWSGHFENKPTGNLVFDFAIDPNSGLITHDKINFLNNLTLGGTLTVIGADSCWENGTFDIISWTGTRTGSFSTVNLPPSYSLVIDDAAKKIRISHIKNCPAMNRMNNAPEGQKSKSEGLMERGEQNQPAPQEMALKVFPVPASDVLNVQVNAQPGLPIQVTLTNAVGQQVYNLLLSATGSDEWSVPVHEFPNGIYCLMLCMGKHKVVRKVVVEHA